jgi:hypothetical protein
MRWAGVNAEGIRFAKAASIWTRIAAAFGILSSPYIRLNVPESVNFRCPRPGADISKRLHLKGKI